MSKLNDILIEFDRATRKDPYNAHLRKSAIKQIKDLIISLLDYKTDGNSEYIDGYNDAVDTLVKKVEEL